jgi:hypothetical protein
MRQTRFESVSLTCAASLCEKGLRLPIEERKQTLKITRDVALSEVADLSILREAQRELGIK